MVGELAGLDEVECHPAYRKGTVTQTDGMLKLDGFHYLIEARWRSDPPDVAAMAALAHKALRALQSTRGLFISIEGFREETVREMETGPKTILLMTGAELSGILEGRWTLDQALRQKVDEGAKKGHIFFDLTRHA
jgi:hypothetical protein